MSNHSNIERHVGGGSARNFNHEKVFGEGLDNNFNQKKVFGEGLAEYFLYWNGGENRYRQHIK